MKKIPGYLDITPTDFMEIYQVAFRHALSRLKDAIKAEEIMTQKVIFVYENTPLPEVIKKMAGNDISGIPVLKEDQTVAGVISEKDVLKRLNNDKTLSFMQVVLKCLETRGCVARDLNSLSAGDIMTFPPVTVKGLTPVSEVADIMDRFNINRVPVVDGNSRLSGIIARSDLVKTLS